MNNSKIVIDNPEESVVDRTPMFRSRESTLVKIIESINRIASTEEWHILRNEVFDDLVETLERRQRQESEKDKINAEEIYRLQGQLAWARKYSDLSKLADFFKLELQNIRKLLKNQNE